MIVAAVTALTLLALGVWLWRADLRSRRRTQVIEALAPLRPQLAHEPDPAATPPLETLAVWLSLPTLLDGAGIAMAPSRFLAALGGLSIALGTIALALSGSIGWALLAGIATPLGGCASLRARRGRREEALQAQLPEAIDVVARAIRSGQPMDAALREAGERMPDPVGRALRRVEEEFRLGAPFERAVRGLAERYPGVAEVRFLVAALVLQRETGGNLAHILERLAATLRERVVFRRDVRAVTAEGRATAIVLALLPLVFMVGIALLRPAYVAPLFEAPTGRALLLAALVLEGVGFMAMRALSRVRV